MSLGIVVKGAEGIVLAAESRVTLQTTISIPGQARPETLIATFDNATKLISFEPPHSAVGVVTYGQAAIGQGRTANSYRGELQLALGSERLTVVDYAVAISDFYAKKWAETMPHDHVGAPMTLVVAGMDDNDPYGQVFSLDIPSHPSPTEQSANDFGITWGGQREYVDRLLRGFDGQLPRAISEAFAYDAPQQELLAKTLEQFQMPLPMPALGLQDCVDLAILLIGTTIAAQRLSVAVRGVGGPIDVATITQADGLKFIQRKRIVGGAGYVQEIER